MATWHRRRPRAGRHVAAVAILGVIGLVLALARLVAVEVSPAECGTMRLHYEGRTWYAFESRGLVNDEARPEWRTYGLVTSSDKTHLDYLDWSGATVVFGDVSPSPPC